MCKLFNLSLVQAITRLMLAAGLLASISSYAMTIEGKKVSVNANSSSVYVAAYMAPVLCPKGGVNLTAIGEYAVDIVSLYCLNDAQVDRLIEGLKAAKAESVKLRSLSKP
ncbi:hypothetical protein [uncultured Shewanella sp.]|uniref:hypothetical protein n=1 Tax=uncultured Shewanella sp. TaxID=173975 RepID=UPI00261A692A|nr:hypothetical protein [uncultured Shewanella sp.]